MRSEEKATFLTLLYLHSKNWIHCRNSEERTHPTVLDVCIFSPCQLKDFRVTTFVTDLLLKSIMRNICYTRNPVEEYIALAVSSIK